MRSDFLISFAIALVFLSPPQGVCASDSDRPAGHPYEAAWPLFRVSRVDGIDLDLPNYLHTNTLIPFTPTSEEIKIVYERQLSFNGFYWPTELVRQALMKIMQVVRDLSIETDLPIDERDVKFFIDRGLYGYVSMLPSTYEILANSLVEADVLLRPQSQSYHLDWQMHIDGSPGQYLWWKHHWQTKLNRLIDPVLDASRDSILTTRRPEPPLRSGRSNKPRALVLTPHLIAKAGTLATARFLDASLPPSRLTAAELNAKNWIELKVRSYASGILQLKSMRSGARLILASKSFWSILLNHFIYEAHPRELSNLVFAKLSQEKLMTLSSMGILLTFAFSREQQVEPGETWAPSMDAYFLRQLEAMAEDLYRQTNPKLDDYSSQLLEELVKTAPASSFLKLSARNLLLKYRRSTGAFGLSRPFPSFSVRQINDEVHVEGDPGAPFPQSDNPLFTLHLEAQDTQLSVRPVIRVLDQSIAVPYLVRLIPELFRMVIEFRPRLDRVLLDQVIVVQGHGVDGTRDARGSRPEHSANDCKSLL